MLHTHKKKKKKTEQSRDVHQRSIVNQQPDCFACLLRERERDNRRWRLCHACLHRTMRRGDCYRSKEAACSTRGTLLRPISFNQTVSRRMSGCILCCTFLMNCKRGNSLFSSIIELLNKIASSIDCRKRPTQYSIVLDY